ncbi:hypothetical protein EDC39_10437 [Geothermobacter ehrlichii]|uniref:Uncharacterized protein n=1 Tax=Geothermobacter ehrlichii TaxID=213224 RepID=A0A5D3WJ06_9BACT|nr:hypothetical protein EDC39_10437 [Geothermobacter ehrlichii]
MLESFALHLTAYISIFVVAQAVGLILKKR